MVHIRSCWGLAKRWLAIDLGCRNLSRLLVLQRVEASRSIFTPLCSLTVFHDTGEILVLSPRVAEVIELAATTTTEPSVLVNPTDR